MASLHTISFQSLSREKIIDMRHYSTPSSLLLLCCAVQQQYTQAAPYEHGDRNDPDDLAKFANGHDMTTGDDIVTYELPWWHPEIEWAIINEVRRGETYYV